MPSTKTPYGTFVVVFTHLKSAPPLDVLIWPDAFGLRPAMRDIAKRIAAQGSSEPVADPFTACQRSASTMTPRMASANSAGADDEDAIA
jgi:carboxymethylenebutenolidase